MNVNIKFGKRLKELRLNKNWTQEDLAFEADLHRAYIGSIERGDKNIGLCNIQKLAKAFDISIAKLLEDL